MLSEDVIGDRIRLLRLKLRLSQVELGNKIDVDESVISRWEANKTRMRRKSIAKIANVLCTSTDYLLGKTDDDRPIVGSTSTNASLSSEDVTPYTKEQINKGMLMYTLNNGERIELPSIQASYDFLRDISSRAACVAVMYVICI